MNIKQPADITYTVPKEPSTSNTLSYNVNDYAPIELLTIIQSFFDLDFHDIHSKDELCELLNEVIQDYKKNNSHKHENNLFFEEAKRKIIFNIDQLEGDKVKGYEKQTDKNHLIESNDDEQHDTGFHLVKQYDEDEINKLYDTFNLKKDATISDLTISYETLRKKISSLDGLTESQIFKLLYHIDESYIQLKGYMTTQAFGRKIKIPKEDPEPKIDDTHLYKQDRFNRDHVPKIKGKYQLAVDSNYHRMIHTNERPSRNYLNPIKREFGKNVINIDTLFRNNYDITVASNFVEEFKEQITNVVSMSITSIELPNVWNAFQQSKDSNYVRLTFYDFNYGGDIYDASYEIRIPDGNYTADEFVTTMNNLLLSAASTGTEYGNKEQNPVNYLRCSVNNITGTTTFRIIAQYFDYASNEEEQLVGTSPYEEFMFDGSTPNVCYSPDMKIKFNFLTTDQQISYDLMVYEINDPSINAVVYNTNNINSSMCKKEIDQVKNRAFNRTRLNPKMVMFQTAGWMMGFREPEYIIDINNVYLDTYSTNFPIHMKGHLESNGVYGSTISTYIYISVDDYNNNHKRNMILNNEEVLGSNNIMAKIPITSGANTMIVYNENDKINKTREYFGPVNIGRLRIQLLDRFGNIIDLHDNNYTMTIEIVQLY
jgi:hypothetical protein